jgi:arabinogalactan endo-1,4-beta-galactosidase
MIAKLYFTRLNSLLFLSFFVLIFLNINTKAQFANGADIGWLSEMEASGYTFYNDNDVRENCMQILQEKGINSLRFRVWVNPTDGYCGKKDVAYMAHRADSMGFRVMIDFHYSDWWADPGKQTKPAAWATHTVDELLADIYAHTYDVLDTLKSLGITPEWVQVGNETNNGMLWPEGKASSSMSNFAKMVNSGYDAVKAIDSTIKVIVHISNGYDNNLFKWMFNGLKNNNARWDVIGMSLYPSWAGSPWATVNTQCLSNMNDMKTRFGKEIILSEVGMPYADKYECNAFLLDLINKVKSVSGLGVFYWEPECYNWESYNMGAWDPVTKKPSLALDAFLGISHQDPSEVKIPYKNSGIEIYPNPSSGEFLNIQLNELSGTTTLKILNLNGQVLNEIIVDEEKVDLSDLRLMPGIYFIQIDNLSQKTVKTFVVNQTY